MTTPTKKASAKKTASAKKKRTDYTRRSQTKMLEAPSEEKTAQWLEESVSILSQKARKMIRQSNTQLDKEIRTVKEVIKMHKDLQEIKIKYLMLENSKDAPDFMQLTQNIMSISPEQLREALKPKQLTGDVNEQNDTHRDTAGEPQGESEVHSDDPAVPKENSDN